jgi:hypothetical protein
VRVTRSLLSLFRQNATQSIAADDLGRVDLPAPTGPPNSAIVPLPLSIFPNPLFDVPVGSIVQAFASQRAPVSGPQIRPWRRDAIAAAPVPTFPKPSSPVDDLDDVRENVPLA